MRRQIFPKALVFFECLALVMFFHQGLSANPMSRLLTVFAVVEDHRLYADRWADQTIDKAFVHGHVYSDKAPLSSALVLPFYAAWRAAHQGADPTSYENAGVHLGDLIAAAIPFALFAVTLFRRASSRLGPWRSFALALFAAFSTPLFNYGNTYYGHMLAGGLLLASYIAAVERGRFVLAGVLAGSAVLTEYPVLVSVALLFGWALTVGPHRIRRALAFAAGGVIPAAALLAYNVAITGRPLDFPYSHVSDTWKTMRTAFGIRGPSPEAAWELVFGQYRGLLFYAPTLAVLVPLALGKRPRPTPGERHPRWLLIALCVSNFLFVCSYFKWDGGWCTGPRHLTAMIVLLVYAGVGRLADEWPRRRVAFYVLGAAGIFVNLAAAATNPIPAEDAVHPLFDVFLPALAAGNLNRHNLAGELGLAGGPWVGSWLLAGWAAAFLVAAFTPSLAAAWIGRRRGERTAAAPAPEGLAELEGGMLP